MRLARSSLLNRAERDLVWRVVSLRGIGTT
jgi:hypothetical protein